MTGSAINELRARLAACWEMGRTGRSTEALVEAQRLLIAARKTGDSEAIAWALTCNAWACLQLGYADEGLDCAVEAKALYREEGRDGGLALSMAVYSWLLLELGLSDLGFEESSAALIVAQRTQDVALQSFAMNCKGMALMMCRQDQLAYPLLEEALDLAEKAGDACTIALNLVNMGFSLVSQAELAEAAGNKDAGLRRRHRAAEANDRAIAAARAYGDLWNLRTALCNAAELSAQLNALDDAVRYLEEWESLPGSVGPRENIHYLYTRGEVLTALGHLDEALAVCQQAVHLATNGSNLDHKANTLRRLSEVETALGRFGDALGHYKAFHEVFVYQMGELTRRRAQIAEMELQNERLRARTLQLEIQASQDALTGLANRRAFEVEFEALHGSLFSLAILDLDHFKSVNDRFSHLAGDEVLQRIAALLSAELHQGSAYRLGGEEFAILLPEVEVAEAYAIVDGIRKAIETSRWDDVTPAFAVTTSIGLADSARFRGRIVLSEADRRLYAAKAAGRNCVVGDVEPSRLAMRA